MSAECVRKRNKRNENPLNTQLMIKKMKRKRIQQQQQQKTSKDSMEKQIFVNDEQKTKKSEQMIFNNL